MKKLEKFEKWFETVKNDKELNAEFYKDKKEKGYKKDFTSWAKRYYDDLKKHLDYLSATFKELEEFTDNFVKLDGQMHDCMIIRKGKEHELNFIVTEEEEPTNFYDMGTQLGTIFFESKGDLAVIVNKVSLRKIEEKDVEFVKENRFTELPRFYPKEMKELALHFTMFNPNDSGVCVEAFMKKFKFENYKIENLSKDFCYIDISKDLGMSLELASGFIDAFSYLKSQSK